MLLTLAGDITVNIGGQTETVSVTDAEQGGTQSRTIYVDFRGANCTDNQVSYSVSGDSGAVASAFYNLLKQVQR